VWLADAVTQRGYVPELRERPRKRKRLRHSSPAIMLPPKNPSDHVTALRYRRGGDRACPRYLLCQIACLRWNAFALVCSCITAQLRPGGV